VVVSQGLMDLPVYRDPSVILIDRLAEDACRPMIFYANSARAGGPRSRAWLWCLILSLAAIASRIFGSTG